PHGDLANMGAGVGQANRRFPALPRYFFFAALAAGFAAAAARLALLASQSRMACHMLLQPIAVPCASAAVSSRPSQWPTIAECQIKVTALKPCAEAGAAETLINTPAASAAYATFFMSLPNRLQSLCRHGRQNG